MQALPEDYNLLKKIGASISDMLNADKNTKTLCLDDVYEYMKQRKMFPRHMWNSTLFSRFMRKMYDYHRGAFDLYIPNCTVDRAFHHHYKWRFYPSPKTTKITSDIKKSEIELIESSNNVFNSNKRYIASNGVSVRSKQELYIITKLLEIEHFKIYYERELTVNGKTKYPDFTILNKKTNTVFYWEHFGLLEKEDYFNNMNNKLIWYKSIGYKIISEGGRLIITGYKDEQTFISLVEAMIRKMDEIIIPVGFIRTI